MNLLRETKKRAKQVFMPVLATVIAGYFLYHTVQGERGLFAYGTLSERVREARTDLAETRTRRETLEHSVRLLRPDSLDLDMLEERARAILNLVDTNDLVIYDSDTR